MPGSRQRAHATPGKTALRGIGAEWMTGDYLRHMHLNLATRYKPEGQTISANLIGALAQIDSGVTTLVDWCHKHHQHRVGRTRGGRPDRQRHPRGVRARHRQAADQGRLEALHPHPASARAHRIPAQGPASRATTAASRSRWRSSAPTGAPGRWSSTTSAWRASSASSRRRTRGGARIAWCQTAITGMAKEGLLGPDHNLVHGTSYMTQPTSAWSSTAAPPSPRPCWSKLHHHIGDTQVAAFRSAGGLPSLGNRTSSPSPPANMFPRDAGRRSCSPAARSSATTRCAGNSRVQADAREVARGAGMGDDRRRARLPDGRQDRHADARQERPTFVMLRFERRQHGSGLRSDLLDRRNRERRQRRHRYHRRHRAKTETASSHSRRTCSHDGSRS